MARSRTFASVRYAAAATSTGAVPPAGSAVITVKVGGDRQTNGSVQGLAGVRLGFCLADADVAEEVRRGFGPWAVSGPAIAVGKAALADREWLDATRVRLARDAARLDGLLGAAGCRILGGTPLFRLVESDRAQDLADALAAAGIHVRRFPHDRRLLRFGLPAGEAAWERLERAADAFDPPRRRVPGQG